MSGERGEALNSSTSHAAAAPGSSSPLPANASRVLVIQTAFLGDVVLTTPLLAALAVRYGPVDVMTTPVAAPLLEHHPAVGEVLRYDKRGRDRGWGGLRRIGRMLKERGYERVYLPHRSWRTGALARLGRIPERIGFADGARLFYTRTVARPRAGHEVDRLMALAGPNAEPPSPAVFLGVSPDDQAEADRWLAANEVTPGFVALAPGSIWGTKRWPYYGELAARLASSVVIVGGPEDRELGQQIVAASGGQAHNAAGALSLLASAALIRRARTLVTNDSAPLHLATAVATPIVAVFGPTVPAFGFGPRRPGDVVIQHQHLSCRPCSKHGPQICPLGHHRCMREIGVELVIEAIKKVNE